MGGRGTWDSTGHFQTWTESNQRWVSEGTISGVKVIHPIGRSNGSLPEYAKTSEAYIARGKDGKLAHLRICHDHFPVLEFDLGHPHHHGMTEGDIHVHHYTKTPQGHPLRSLEGKPPTADEWTRWGEVVKQMIERNK